LRDTVTVTEAASREGFRPLADVVNDYIDMGIKAAGGNMSEAAKLLGVGRATLYRRSVPGSVRARFRRSPRVRLEEKELLKARVLKLRLAVDEACRKAAGDYGLGMANGLIQALHVMEGRTGSPSYL
jgi:hypothetical protein